MTILEYSKRYGASVQYMQRLIREKKTALLMQRGIKSYRFVGGTALLLVDNAIAYAHASCKK